MCTAERGRATLRRIAERQLCRGRRLAARVEFPHSIDAPNALWVRLREQARRRLFDSATRRRPGVCGCVALHLSVSVSDRRLRPVHASPTVGQDRSLRACRRPAQTLLRPLRGLEPVDVAPHAPNRGRGRWLGLDAASRLATRMGPLEPGSCHEDGTTSLPVMGPPVMGMAAPIERGNPHISLGRAGGAGWHSGRSRWTRSEKWVAADFARQDPRSFRPQLGACRDLVKEDPDVIERTASEALPVGRAEVRPVGADAHRPADHGAGGGRGRCRPHDDRDVEAGRPRRSDRRVGGVTAGPTAAWRRRRTPSWLACAARSTGCRGRSWSRPSSWPRCGEKRPGDERSGPRPRRRGRQGGAARRHRRRRQRGLVAVADLRCAGTRPPTRLALAAPPPGRPPRR